MLSILILLPTVFALFVLLLKPKWGSYLIWIILFAYPHGWWSNQSFLPLNIGADDLFALVLFIMVVFRRNFLEGLPIRTGFGFWVITLGIGAFSLATFSSYIHTPAAYTQLHVKVILKGLIYWGLFYAILHTIDDRDDLKKQISAFCIAAVIGALLVVLNYFSPSIGEIFHSPELVWKKGLMAQGRAMGAFDNPNTAAFVLSASLIFLVIAIRLQARLSLKLLIYSAIGIFLLGIMMTKSRAGLLTVVGSFFLMGIFSKNKGLCILVIVGAFVVLVLFPQVRSLYFERIRMAYNPETGDIGPNVLSRIAVWKSYFQTLTPEMLLFGQGRLHGQMINGTTTHNAFVALIAVYGFPGFFWAVGSLFLFLRRVYILRFSPYLDLRAMSSLCFWGLVAWGIYGMSADAIGSQYPRYILFYLVVLLDRTFSINRQQLEMEYADVV